MRPDPAESCERAMRTVVALCEDLTKTGLDLGELGSSLEGRFPGTTVDVSSDLCGHPEALADVIHRHRAERVVLGLCSHEYSRHEVQSRVRKAGLDPFGVEVVVLDTPRGGVHALPETMWKAGALLGAAVSRARAYQGSSPENTVPYFLPREEKVTRRSLLTMPPISYRPVPSIGIEQCAARAGCDLCVRTCPLHALERSGDRILVDKTRCEGCGVCLASCPREAIDFPGWSPGQFEAQIAALLDYAALREGILCQLMNL